MFLEGSYCHVGLWWVTSWWAQQVGDLDCWTVGWERTVSLSELKIYYSLLKKRKIDIINYIELYFRFEVVCIILHLL